MKRIVFMVTVALVMAAMMATAGPAVAQTNGGVSGVALPTVLNAQLTGEQEAPEPGDPDGSGSATIITVPPDKICYTLTASRIAPANAAHIHEAPPGEAGPVVVPLDAPTFGVSGGCTTADPALVSDIAANPSNYYVNVHNDPYPAGAIRGQLH